MLGQLSTIGGGPATESAIESIWGPGTEPSGLQAQ